MISLLNLATYIRKIVNWIRLLLKNYYGSTYVIKRCTKIHNNYVFTFLDTNLQKEFSADVTDLFNNTKMLNKFDDIDVIQIGEMYANTIFFKK
ncbi:MAG: hypothetical protein K2P99_01760 [Burkholderiales bacterium]|nr:hypothetical protein [Burkholderiales bacterium]